MIGQNAKLNEALLTIKILRAEQQALNQAHYNSLPNQLSNDQAKTAVARGEKIARMRHELTLANRVLADNSRPIDAFGTNLQAGSTGGPYSAKVPRPWSARTSS